MFRKERRKAELKKLPNWARWLLRFTLGPVDICARLGRFVGMYIGGMIFLYVSVYVIFSYIANIAAYMAAVGEKDGSYFRVEAAKGILWLIVGLPHITILYYLNSIIVGRFFDNFWESLNCFKGLTDDRFIFEWFGRYDCKPPFLNNFLWLTSCMAFSGALVLLLRCFNADLFHWTNEDGDMSSLPIALSVFVVFAELFFVIIDWFGVMALPWRFLFKKMNNGGCCECYEKRKDKRTCFKMADICSRHCEDACTVYTLLGYDVEEGDPTCADECTAPDVCPCLCGIFCCLVACHPPKTDDCFTCHCDTWCDKKCCPCCKMERIVPVEPGSKPRSRTFYWWKQGIQYSKEEKEIQHTMKDICELDDFIVKHSIIEKYKTLKEKLKKCNKCKKRTEGMEDQFAEDEQGGHEEGRIEEEETGKEEKGVCMIETGKTEEGVMVEEKCKTEEGVMVEEKGDEKERESDESLRFAQFIIGLICAFIYFIVFALDCRAIYIADKKYTETSSGGGGVVLRLFLGTLGGLGWVIVLNISVQFEYLLCRVMGRLDVTNGGEKHSDGRPKYSRLTLCSIGAIATFVFAILFTSISGSITRNFKAKTLDQFEYMKQFNETVITFSPQPAMCKTQVSGWSILDLAGVSMAAMSSNDEVLRNVSKLLFQDFRNADREEWRTNDHLVIISKRSTYSSAIGFESVARSMQAGVLLESVASYWWSYVVGIVIPFFDVVREFMMNGILDALARLAAMLFSTSNELTYVMTNDLEQYWQLHVDDYRTAPVFTGHSLGGLLAEYMSDGLNVSEHERNWAVSFETPDYEATKLKSLEGGGIGGKMVKCHGPLSLFSVDGGPAAIHVSLPKYQSITKPANVFETFCLIAAACSDTDKYDVLCTQTVGADKYMDYFDKWNRKRTDIA